MTYRYYTGVGSRETPSEVLGYMKELASWLSYWGFVLRSGGAPGADSAFEAGASISDIYLPWPGFNGSRSCLFNLPHDVQAAEMASEIHPAWGRLTQGAKKLHARNVYQVLGSTLTQPSEFLVCWTRDGEDVGGTRTAIVLARRNNVLVFNVGAPDGFKRLNAHLRGICSS